MKAIWKGTLQCGLLSTPVKLYAAVDERTIGARLLCAKCHTPIQYQRYCPHCKKNIDWRNVVRGIAMDDESYFILTEEKLEKIKPESSDYIDIIEFVPTDIIDSIYYDHHYFLAPHKITEKFYFLLQHTINDMKVSGICRMIIREKEYVCALQSYENGFLLTTLNYNYEILSISDIEQLSVKVSAKATKTEQKLTEQLIKRLSKKTFNMDKFKDTFAEKLREAIKRAAAGKKIIKERAIKSVARKVVPKNLEATLKESIAAISKKPKALRKRK